jgi:hypothetical protein
MTPRRILAAAALVLVAATVLMLAGVEPFASWYYLFAWYSTIAIADAWTEARDPRRRMLLARPQVFVSLLSWSAVLWFTFELWNLRLENWYYVGVSDRRVVRWMGTAFAFATVLPGIFAVTRLLAAYGLGERFRGAAIRMSPGRLRFLTALGVASALLVLLWPQCFFPLVWGVTFFLAAPFNYRRGGPGLLRRIEAGRWGTVVRLLGAGAICGLLWELFNIRASAKWIYTVPGFEDGKLFEMPLLGFVGFPPFALECYEMLAVAIHLRIARPWEDGAEAGAARSGAARAGAAGARAADADEEEIAPAPAKRAVVAGAGIALSLIALVFMDRFTIDSMTPRPKDLPAVDAALASELAGQGVDEVAELRRLLASPHAAERLGMDAATEKRVRDQIELALLRGIGAQQTARLVAAGIGNLSELAGIEEGELEQLLETAHPERRWHPARLRVWVHAARERLAEKTSGAGVPPASAPR